MTLRAKRIVPIRVSPTCVGTALTSSSSLGRASDGSRSGGSLHCGRKTPQKGIGQIPPVGKGSGPPRLEDVYVRRRPVEFAAVSFFHGDLQFLPSSTGSARRPAISRRLAGIARWQPACCRESGWNSNRGSARGVVRRSRRRTPSSSAAGFSVISIVVGLVSECRGTYSSLHLLPGPPSR